MKVTTEMVERALSAFKGRRMVDPPWQESEAAMRAALEAVLTDVPEPGADMLGSLKAWWERHALSLRMTSRSVHHAIGVALTSLERGQPFPTMQVLADVPEPDAPPTGRGPEELRLRIGFERMKQRADAAEAKLQRVREWMRDDAIEAGAYDRLHAILEEP